MVKLSVLKYQQLRKQYSQFIYDDFSVKKAVDKIIITYYFQIPPDYSFRPQLVIPTNNDQITINNNLITNLIFQYGLIEMFSYWKLTCSPEIIVKAGSLDDWQINWWQDLLFKGMSQYFYENKINFLAKDFITIKPTVPQSITINKLSISINNRSLIPIGGGKDSLVVWELLKETNSKLLPFVLSNNFNPPNNALKIANSLISNPLIITRIFDPQLFKLNQQGFLNGHIPFSANVAFVSLLGAYLTNSEQIVVANEQSANEANLTYLNQPINHQYSKSYQFEKNFRQYLKHINLGINYFSLLRPLNEIQITEIFSHYPQYFRLFSSCNRQQNQGLWCGQCPKCSFVYLSLFPFLKKDQLKLIFKKEPLINQNLVKIKPFECVGTYEEINALLKFYQTNDRQILDRFLTAWNKQHFVLVNLLKILKNEVKSA